MRPTQAIESFGNVSVPFDILAICDLSVNILRRFSVRRVKHKSGNDFVPIERYISETVRDRTLVLIPNRKSNMTFRVVPNWVTLDNLERCNRTNSNVISPNLVALGTDYVKVVEDTPILSAAEM